MKRHRKISIVTEPAINELNEEYGTLYSLHDERGTLILLDYQFIDKAFVTVQYTLDYEEIKYFFNKAICELQTGQERMETAFVPAVLTGIILLLLFRARNAAKIPKFKKWQA